MEERIIMGSNTEGRIAVVGAGIAGMFCAYVLGKNGRKVDLFEASDRLGGRIRTIRLDRKNKDLPEWTRETMEFYAEFGPMRVELEKQRLLKALLDHLDIKTKDVTDDKKNDEPYLIDFPSYSSPASEHDPQYELRPEEEGKTPLELLEMALLRIVLHLEVSADNGDGGDCEQQELCDFKKKQGKLRTSVMLAAATSQPTLHIFEEWTQQLTQDDYWVIQTQGKILRPDEKQATPLYAVGFWNLLSNYLSHNAITKLRDLGTFYHLLPENPNAAEWLVWWLLGFSITENLQGISGGMECIIEKLHEKIDQLPEVEINLEHKLKSVCKAEDGKLGLIFSGETCEEFYDHLVLALPRRALEKVVANSHGVHGRGVFPGEIEDLVHSAFGFPMVKVFAVVKNRWWERENMANRFATRIPTRELHYWKGRTKESRQGLIMAYTDRPASVFWSNYVPPGEQQDVTRSDQSTLQDAFWDRLKRKLVQYINQTGDVHISVRDILWCGIRDWGRAPFSGANHAWRPERLYWVVMRRLADMKVEGCEARIHVCGEAYSDYHGFIEGPLRSSYYVLRRILKGQGVKKDDILKALDGFQASLEKPYEGRPANAKSYFSELESWAEKLDKPKYETDEFIFSWERKRGAVNEES